LVEGGRYSVEFAIYVAIAKYLYHLPLERQVRMYLANGLYVDNARSAVQGWYCMTVVNSTISLAIGIVWPCR
jgi:hypothetical protein